MSKTLWETTEQEASEIVERSRGAVKDLVIIAVTLTVIWGVTVIVAL